MRVLDVLKVVSEELGLSEISDKIEDFETGLALLLEKNNLTASDDFSSIKEDIKVLEDGVVGSDKQKDIRRMVGSLNRAIENIVTTSIPNLKSQIIQTDAEGKVSLDAFDGGVLNILKCTNIESREDVDYLLMPFHLYLPKAETSFLVKYRSGGKQVKSLLDLVEISPLVQIGVLARATIYEYLLSKNCYSEAEFWKSSFEEALKWAIVKNSNRKLKSNPL